jgi:hypothetical protein
MPVDDRPPDPRRQRFLATLQASLADGSLERLVLSKPKDAAPELADLQRVQGRLLPLRGAPHLSLVWRHDTRDITRNLPLDQAVAQVDALLGAPFRHAHLHTRTQELELRLNRLGAGALSTRQRAADEAAPADGGAPATHNREKQRWIAQDAPFLTALGVTTAQHQLVPAMAAKWKQINKFVEVFAHALQRSPLAGAQHLNVVDFGAGKGYLTFAVHDWLQRRLGAGVQVVGVELRGHLVAHCNAAIEQLGLQGLRFHQGDVSHWQADPAHPVNVMIALHACDTATDHAIAFGIRQGADIILCSPCCHKQLRPQLLKPHPLAPLLQHGIHCDEQAEMLTDGLRALLLQAQGYDTQVFEFISLEHTAKNKMILAVKRAQPLPREPVLRQIQELKQFFGVREQALEMLLATPGP